MIDLNKLTGFFPESEVLWRVARCGSKKDGSLWARVLAYIDARSVQNRLDAVCGPEGWSVTYQTVQGGFLCGLLIKIGDEWVTKWDGADQTDIEGFKGGISKALVRAASAWGIGRYFYEFGESFADIVAEGTPGSYWSETKEKKPYYWLPPKIPAAFLPPETVQAPPKGIAPKVVKPGPKTGAQPKQAISAEIFGLAKKMNMSEAECLAWAKEYSGKEPTQMTLGELEVFRNHLLNEAGRNGIAV